VVCMPASDDGNRVFKVCTTFKDMLDQEHETHMPGVFLWIAKGAWNIAVTVWVPGPGPGDFMESFASEEETLNSILSYFFNPNDARFLALLSASTERWERINALDSS
jgi:hypothetical protein